MRQYAGKMSIKTVFKVPTQKALVGMYFNEMGLQKILNNTIVCVAVRSH